jgi:hypothetical protein
VIKETGGETGGFKPGRNASIAHVPQPSVFTPLRRYELCQ